MTRTTGTMRRNSLLLACCLMMLKGAAQAPLSVVAPLSPAAATGFYRIPVSAQLSALTRSDMGDIRLLDQNGRQVPFLLQAKPTDSLLRNPAPALSQTDSSDGTSYLCVIQAAAYPIDRISISVESPHFFLRKIRVGKSGSPPDRWVAMALRSGRKPLEIRLPAAIKTDSLCIRIENGDNAPLRITGIETHRRLRCLVAWLEAGHPYRIGIGSGTAAAPDYDLIYFRDSIPAVLPELGYGDFTPQKKESRQAAATDSTSGKSAKRGNGWIWPVIIGSVAVLGALAWRLLADMKRRGL